MWITFQEKAVIDDIEYEPANKSWHCMKLFLNLICELTLREVYGSKV